MTGLRYGPAPFQAIAGVSYETPISADWGIGVTVDGYFYNRTPAWLIPYSPGGEPHEVVNASLRLSRLDESWQIALIATNLFDDRWYAPANTDKPLGTPGDITSDSPVPRLVTLQATFRF